MMNHTTIRGLALNLITQLDAHDLVGTGQTPAVRRIACSLARSRASSMLPPPPRGGARHRFAAL